MEKYKTIDEYIATEMAGKIESRRKSPVMPLVVLALGVALLVLMRAGSLADSMQMLVLTLGVLTLAVGIVLTAMSFSGAMRFYRYEPTRSRMTNRKVYVGSGDYGKAVDAIQKDDKDGLDNLRPDTNSNGAIHLVRSRDGAIALLQAGRFDSGHFEPDTPVMCLTANDVTHISSLCK